MMHKLMKQLFILVIILITTLFITELALRHSIKLYDHTQIVYQYNPEYYFDFKPNTIDYYRFEDRNGEPQLSVIPISSQGIADRYFDHKQPGEYRILMLGDSFTEGLTVDPKDSIPKQVELLLKQKLNKNISVVNLGLSGAGCLQELGILKNKGLKLEPDLVVLELFPGNDLSDALAIKDKYLKSYGLSMKQWLAHWHNNQYISYRFDYWMEQNSAIYQVIRRLTKKPLIVDFTKIFYPSIQLEVLPPNDNIYPVEECNLKDWYPELEDGMLILREYILKMKDLCDSNGIPMMIYYIHTSMDFCPDIENIIEFETNRLYEPCKAINKLRDWCSLQQIHDFDCLQEMKQFRYLDDVLVPKNGHYTKEGYHAIAAALTNDIIDNYF